MHIEIVSIGNELLSGRVVNTNAAFLCKQLRLHGYTVHLQTTLPDDPASLKRGLNDALARSALVIATGGLGPTLDDRTQEVAADLLACTAQELPNPIGSAPGLIFAKRLILLPGVPREMEALFLEEVLPFLRREYAGAHKETLVLHFCLVYESQLDPHLRTLASQYPHVDIGIYPSCGTVAVSLSGSNPAELLACQQFLEQQFTHSLYLAPSGKIEEALYLTCKQRHKTLACAESCTGGRIAAALTSIPGASEYFLGSLVTYSNALKHDLLGVSASQDVVSARAVTEMLHGVFAATKADLAIAVSGIAGPAGGSADKPVGLVYAAIGVRGEPPEVGSFHIRGNREHIAQTTALYLIGALWRKLEKGVPVFPLNLSQ